jgi:uncharacterized protein (TIGR02996 family)
VRRIRRNKKTRAIVGAEISVGRDGEHDERVVAQVAELLARPEAAGIRELDVVLASELFDEVLRAAATARQLESLTLRRASLSGDGGDLKILDGHPSLRRIEIAPGVVDMPSSMPRLEELVLDPQVLDGQSVRDLAGSQLPAIRTIELHCNSPSDSVDIAVTPADLAVFLGSERVRPRTLALHELRFYADAIGPVLLASPLVAGLETLILRDTDGPLVEMLAPLACRVVTEAFAREDDELRARILATPDAVEPYLVLADWLAERGDPRAELIGAQHARLAKDTPALRRRERELLRRHAFLPSELSSDEVSLEVTWFMGHLKTASLSCDRDHEWIPSTLLQLPVARYLRRLEVEARGGARIEREGLVVDAPAGCEVIVRRRR